MEGERQQNDSLAEGHLGFNLRRRRRHGLRRSARPIAVDETVMLLTSPHAIDIETPTTGEGGAAE